jgi:hypothetical protein
MFSALARRRLAGRRFRTRRASSETANHSLRTVRRLHSGSDHLRKQVNIIVGFTRHVFSNRVQHFQKLWPSIHLVLSFVLCTSILSVVSCPSVVLRLLELLLTTDHGPLTRQRTKHKEQSSSPSLLFPLLPKLRTPASRSSARKSRRLC